MPPGWDRWFATGTAAFYNYGVTTKSGFRHYGSRHSDYITRVLNDQAQRFVAKGTAPFFCTTPSPPPTARRSLTPGTLGASPVSGTSGSAIKRTGR